MCVFEDVVAIYSYNEKKFMNSLNLQMIFIRRQSVIGQIVTSLNFQNHLKKLFLMKHVATTRKLSP